MCGLFGAIGVNIDPQKIRLLAVLNETRGKDATGFFNSHGAWWKRAQKATEELQDRRTTRWLEDSCKKTWAVCGHTRAGTRGGAATKNAHPFSYGQVIGSHNGTIQDPPNSYAVDSEWAFDLLSKSKPGEYQQALGSLSGWYVLTWLDRREKAVYLLNWEGQLNVTFYQGAWYYSSQADHLRTAIGVESMIANVAHTKVLKFWFNRKEGLKHEELTDFTGKKKECVNTNRTAWNSRGGRGYSHYDDGEDATVILPTTTLGQGSRSRTPPDPTLPTGFITRFPNGLWHAQLLNCKYRLLSCQSTLNDQYANSKPGERKWMKPGQVRANLTPISPATPAIDPPPGFAVGPALLEEVKVLGQTTPLVIAEKKSESQSSGAAFQTEEEQERASLEAVQAATIDRDGADIERIVLEQQKRFDMLTKTLDLTSDEATRVMTLEGYFGNLGS